MATQRFFEFSPRSLGKWSNLTNIFQMGWNHQLGLLCTQQMLLQRTLVRFSKIASGCFDRCVFNSNWSSQKQSWRMAPRQFWVSFIIFAHLIGDRPYSRTAPLSWSWDFTCNPLKVSLLAGDLRAAMSCLRKCENYGGNHVQNVFFY